jgi:CDP-diacylglycerol---glycerol-3-phosphate 3-phosphatidyltransferase
MRNRVNWANRLTIARFFLTLLFVAALSVPWTYAASTALVLFVLAGVTDYADGEIARRCGLVSDFGKLMDPLVDKIMIAAAFICLVDLQAIPAWVAVAIVSREFLITGLRLLAASKGQVLPAERLGKHKTAWQIVTILYFLALLAAPELSGAADLRRAAWWLGLRDYGGGALIACALVLTLYSGFGYLWKHRALIEA